MSTFDLMKAKCTLETDRLAMERSVLKLFDRPRGQKSEVGRSAKSEEDAEGRSVEMVPSTRRRRADGGRECGVLGSGKKRSSRSCICWIAWTLNHMNIQYEMESLVI